MKTLISAAAATLAAATVLAAAPAAAQVAPGAAAAIVHFNQDEESANDRRSIRTVGQGVALSTRSGSTRAIYDRFNADHDGQDNVRGLAGATRISGRPSHGADIFAAIRRASAEDE